MTLPPSSYIQLSPKCYQHVALTTAFEGSFNEIGTVTLSAGLNTQGITRFDISALYYLIIESLLEENF
jgi:hypothetical protein